MNNHIPYHISNFNILEMDLYQLTMVQSHWMNGNIHQEAVFNSYYRKPPFSNSYYIISCGQQIISDIISYWNRGIIGFNEEIIDKLSDLKTSNNEPIFNKNFLYDFLLNIRLDIDVYSVPEGTEILPYEPIMSVKGNLLKGLLLETFVVHYLNHQSLIATNAHLFKNIIKDDCLLEFGCRRTGGGILTSRACYIGGTDYTSNVAAGIEYQIPVSGTMAYNWILSHDTQLEAFENYIKVSPNQDIVLLIDTYGTMNGLNDALTAMREAGQDKRLVAVRLDSGDPLTLSQKVRDALDQKGFHKTKIIASDSLSLSKIKELKNNPECKIDIWGIGTNLVSPKNIQCCGIVCKLGAIRNPYISNKWEYKEKKSDNEEQASVKGLPHISRYIGELNENGESIYPDIIFDKLKNKNENSYNITETIIYHGDRSTLSQNIHETRNTLLSKNVKICNKFHNGEDT